jgi:peptidyl-prolyl cis-trans isomerase C
MPIFVGGVEIADRQVFEEMQYQDQTDTVKEACFLAAQSLVIKQLLLNTAFKQKIIADLADKALADINTEEEEQMINALVDQSVAVPEAGEEVCKRYYQKNQSKFTDKKLGKILPFEQVAGHIEEYLSAQSLMNGISEYIQVLAANTKIKGFDFKDPEAMMVDLEGLNKAGDLNIQLTDT